MRSQANRGQSGNARFAAIPSVENPRSTFNRSHGHKTTFDSGLLIPIYVDEVLPGDTLKLGANSFARMATPLKPVMDNVYLDLFFFAVPYRLIWENSKRFFGERDPNPDSSVDFLTPKMNSGGGYPVGSMPDYMGIPTEVGNIEHLAFPMRAYNLIYNEWFRDENLQDSAPVPVDDGPDDPIDYQLRRRGKRPDYFTSCLPFPQKGPAVDLPLGGQAPLGGVLSVDPSGGAPSFNAGNFAGTLATASVNANTSPFYTGSGALGPLNWEDPNLEVDLADPGAFADLSLATAATINQIRQAFQIQRLYERDARGGSRYTEIVRSHFGVISPDARLQRPEYLGGGSSLINVHPVAQTSGTDGQPSPQGNLAAFATGSAQGQGFTKSFTEHSVIIGLAMVRADLTYQQGLNRMWSRSTRFDYYWPSFAHLGEQEVLSKEIFANGDPEDDDVFGYQERYAEYRYKPSIITGQFRSTFAQSLDVWHLAQEFPVRPLLNASFIEENPPIDRVIAVPSEPEGLYDAWFNIHHVRPMPTYSVPGLVDHF